MKRRFIPRGIFFFCAVLAWGAGMGAPAAGESFRVGALRPVALGSITQAKRLEAHVNDALLVLLPDDMTFVSGVEINVKIPEAIAAYADVLAYSLYGNVKPAPSEKKTDYSGKCLSAAAFPPRLSLTLYIPLSDEFHIKDSPYAEIIGIEPKIIDKKLFVRFYPLLRKMPAELAEAALDVSVRCVIVNKGRLDLAVEPGQSAAKHYTVYIDEKPYNSTRGIFLPPGEHHAAIISDSYRNEVRTFVIEAAKTTAISVSLRTIEPTVRISCPEGAQVFWDGQLVERPGREFTVAQGEHSVRIVLGGYEVVKKVVAVKGHSYVLGTSIDVTISDEE